MQQDELFLLIKSLTKNEKKFFTQYVNLYEKNGSPVYLRLFNFLNDEAEYDEEKIFKKFRDKNFRKNYAVTRHYLKNLIIKTLRHSELTVREESDLTVYVLDIKRLMAKGLFGMAKKMIEKLKTEAYADEKLMDIIQLIAMQRGLVSMGYYRHEPEVSLDKLDEEEELLLERITELRKVMNALIKLYSLMHFELNVLPTEVLAEIKKLGDTPLLKRPDELRSAKAKHSALQFWALYHSALGDYASYLLWAERKLAFAESEGLPHSPSVNWKILAYNHCLSASFLTKDYSRFEMHLQYLENLELQSSFHDAELFQTVSIYGLLYHLHFYNPEKTERYIAYSKDGITRLTPFLRKVFVYTLRTLIAYAYLRLGKLDDCMKEVNDLLALTNGETRRDYLGHVKIINLMLRYEMKEGIYLSHLIKNTYRYFASYLYATPLHQLVIAYLKEALKTKTRQEFARLNDTYTELLSKTRFPPTEADMALAMMIEDYIKSKSSDKAGN
ncbi:MAG: hypothetical protein KIS94_02740 [Chitinophagales bacterium]|nr:hypothetical protein [Chitinophagales bacterium]